MRQPPTPRERIYDLYWYFAAERQAAFQRRVEGKSWPWTNDKILQEFKFCNVFRAADRVSQFMIREVACNPDAGSPDDQLFQIVAFRTFSKIDTWRSVKDTLGHYPTLNDLSSGAFLNALNIAKRHNGGLYTGAFILCATDAFGYSEKHYNHVALFKKMFLQDELAPQLRAAKSLSGVYDLLHQYPLMGDFMSYQIAIDLNYSDQIPFDENDFTQPGPGALRGLAKAFVSLGDYKPSEVILWMVQRQNEEFTRLKLSFQGLWGRPLHAIDCQGLFCELDKYCREAAPELVSARTRIKTRYNEHPNPIRLMFPPKWSINRNIPKHDVFGKKPSESNLQQSLL